MLLAASTVLCGADEAGRIACQIPQGRGWWLTKLHSTVHKWLVKEPWQEKRKCSACVDCFQPPVNRQFEIGTYLVHIWWLGKAGKFSSLLKNSNASDDSFVRCWCGISARICRTK